LPAGAGTRRAPRVRADDAALLACAASPQPDESPSSGPLSPARSGGHGTRRCVAAPSRRRRRRSRPAAIHGCRHASRRGRADL